MSWNKRLIGLQLGDCLQPLVFLVLKTSVALTHWGRDKMACFSQTTFSNAFSWMKMNEFRLRFHWSLFLGIELTISQHWFRWWLGAVQAKSHYLNQWWLVYRCIYASLGLNELNNFHTMANGMHSWNSKLLTIETKGEILGVFSEFKVWCMSYFYICCIWLWS